MTVPPGRPPLPPDQRRPRSSGPSGPSGRARAPTPEEAARQQALLLELAADLGAELHRRGKTGAGPASWNACGRAAGLSDGTALRVAMLPASHPRARHVTEATLLRWERRIRSYIAGESDPADDS